MANGCGVLGHCAQQHVEWELRHETKFLAMGHFMLGCLALEMEWRLKVVRVSLYKFTLLFFSLIFLTTSFQLKVHGQPGDHGVPALQHVVKEQDQERETSMEGFHVQAMQRIQKYANVS